MPSAVDNLMKKAATVQRHLLRSKNQVLNFGKHTVSITELKLVKSELEDQRLKLVTVYDEVSDLTTADEFKVHDPTFNTLFSATKNMQVEVGELLAEKEAAAKTKISCSFKLERIKLPQFKGNSSEWQSFHDLFMSSVHLNVTLSGAEKMIHLKSSLVGEAATIISSFQPTDANYQQAWDLVVKRYSHKREIIFAHIRKFDDLKPNQMESAVGLRNVSDTISECIRSLKNLAVPVDHWDLIMIYLALKKLSAETRKQWLLQEKAALPTLDKFIEYLELRARALADSECPQKIKASSSGTKKSSSHMTSSSTSLTCPLCSEAHHLHKCKAFFGSSVPERRDLVSKKQLCFNCLFPNHSVSKCKMEFTCRKCSKRHHTLLHNESVVTKPPLTSTVTISDKQASSSDEPDSVTSSHSTYQGKSNNVVLMGTLLVIVKDSSGVNHKCRVFVDPGSESNFITEFCVDRLGLKRKKTCVSVSGISGSTGETATGLIKASIHSTVRDFHLKISALVLKKITNKLPRAQCKFDWPHLNGLELGDPSFNIPGHIDILLGATDAALIMLPDIKYGSHETPSAQNTQFGWMISGCVNQTPAISYHVQSCHSQCSLNETCLETTLSKFWDLEEPEILEQSISEEDAICEAHFEKTHVRNPDGGYTVELPFKISSHILGESRTSALRRFSRVENRLCTHPEIKEEYIKGMQQYMALNFMELVPPEEISSSKNYYMPHSVVVKPSSSTTKYRIVYDASAKSSTGYSLNDVLMTGPKLQVDLVPLLIRFRSYRVAMSADIVKFYPQFIVDQKHVDFQRLIWRENASFPIQDYRMLRLTFGVTTAPFLAIRCLHQLADDEKEQFPLAASAIKEDFLVDNLLSGADDIDSALSLQNEVLEVMERGNLKLTKWSSNTATIVNAVPPDQRESEFPHSIQEDEALKTIGILWNPMADTFGISINVPEISHPITKRKVLSYIAKTFDPLGWLSPVTVSPKILMQLLWKEMLDWDSPLPSKFSNLWLNYCKDLVLLQSFRISRCLKIPSNKDLNQLYELHGFSDASLVAYSACVYLKTISKHGNYVNLIIAKTKVAPVKTETIPRLELCAAGLLSKLVKIVLKSIDIKFHVICCWTDSTIVLDWIKSTKQLPVFVANRVRKIKVIISSDAWYHVEGVQNPADAASRGISSTKFLNDPLWLSGPSWLLTNTLSTIKEDNKSYFTVADEPNISEFINKSSSYSRMKRVIAYCHRFIHNCQLNGDQRLSGTLTVDELNQALYSIIRNVQKESFAEDIDRLLNNLIVLSRVKFLVPFLDPSGLLRVGGRLIRSTLSYQQQHPLLLPKKHQFTDTLVRYYHLTYLHAGPQLLLSIIRDRFWIIRGSDAAKRIVRQCIICHRQNPATTNQLMGSLPSARVILSKPFSKTGMDYAGPFMLCLIPGRNPKLVKCYVSIFVCMATKAIHLELVGDLTTPSFVSALSRFIARRGLPSDVYCDGGKNFVGAKNEMIAFGKLMKSTLHQDAMDNFYSSKEIRYHLNPPLAPHHGGLWEAGLKSMKKHLKRVIENRHLSLEEFSTLLCHVEACLNSRPLTRLSTDPNDFGVLTPGHFLIGEALLTLPQHNIMEVKINRLSRWQVVQQMHQHFWRRWNTEYLNTLQTRPKWFAAQPNLEVGTLVLIRDDEPTWGLLKWKLGRISVVYPGSDGKVRVCDIKTASGAIYKRSVVNLSPLPIYK